jgi:hypothetical protein
LLRKEIVFVLFAKDPNDAEAFKIECGVPRRAVVGGLLGGSSGRSGRCLG